MLGPQISPLGDQIRPMYCVCIGYKMRQVGIICTSGIKLVLPCMYLQHTAEWRRSFDWTEWLQVGVEGVVDLAPAYLPTD